MKIKLDKNGYLWLERAGKMKQAWCPNGSHRDKIYVGDRFQTYFSYSPCGDWCSLFREGIGTRNVEVFLCENHHYCTINNFTDERGNDAG